MTTELLLASIIVLFSSMLLTLFLERKHNISFTITIISLGLASILNGISLLNPPSQPIGEVSTDAFSQALLLIALLDMIIALIGFRDPSREYKHPGGLFLLVAASVLGLLGIAWSGSILMLFASWMLFSVSSYALMAIPRDGFSASGAAKYGLMGLAATNLFLLFLGILVSSTGTLSLYTHTPLAITTALGLMTLILASVGFKIGVFPFHAWLPDAYGYADPLPISVIAPLSKTATVLVLYKLSVTLIPSARDLWTLLFGTMAVLTMTYGNITALLQPGLQGLLAYSSIAQAGYLLIGVASLAIQGGETHRYALYGLAIQLLAYSLAKTGLFLFAKTLRKKEGRPILLNELGGLGQVDPLLSASVAILTLSLMGMPPLTGFWGKLYLFLAPASQAPWLTGLALLNTGIAAAYYVRLIKALYWGKGEPKPSYPATTAAVKILAVLTLITGVIPFILGP
ncbi:MAG: NADH-quinone oxidoreductase subunit N [Infirmifilum sp.]|uniref:NADH:quinone oxidoreductase/Mrp antiporter transmembrane domain-containing protein n=1 Tax=Infirmifilum uzonense TaxID=1550241 RepID=A0A0F7FHK9_9CREN|nr:NADH-quinone oxidoreductase subunit N [Infirmifilum uzonense]AKG38660.1 hypothetical protein MA03_04300 [Infirmifilum uzonense]